MSRKDSFDDLSSPIENLLTILTTRDRITQLEQNEKTHFSGTQAQKCDYMLI